MRGKRPAPNAFSVFLLAGILQGCFQAHDGHLDGGPPGEGGLPTDGGRADGGLGERCGRVRCAATEGCCNASCGICVPPGGGCPAIYCFPDCSPQEARGSGACERVLGWFWDGAACRTLSGCECVGADCPRLFESPDECLGYFGDCERRCEPDDAEPVGPCRAVIGARWTRFGCEEISGCGCAGRDCMEVVGRSLEDCNRAHEGCPVPVR